MNRPLEDPSKLCLITLMISMILLGLNHEIIHYKLITTTGIFAFLISGIGLGVSLFLFDLKLYKKESWRINNKPKTEGVK